MLFIMCNVIKMPHHFRSEIALPPSLSLHANTEMTVWQQVSPRGARAEADADPLAQRVLRFMMSAQRGSAAKRTVQSLLPTQQKSTTVSLSHFCRYPSFYGGNRPGQSNVQKVKRFLFWELRSYAILCGCCSSSFAPMLTGVL